MNTSDFDDYRLLVSYEVHNDFVTINFDCVHLAKQIGTVERSAYVSVVAKYLPEGLPL